MDTTTKNATATDSIKMKVANAYDALASSDDYRRNDANLRVIQIAVVTVSAIATGFTNSLAHKDRLSTPGAIALAILIAVFVERFYFVLRHGLTTTYKSGKQRTYAQICHKTIIATMMLNACILTAWIVGTPLPDPLAFWYRWSLAVHFALALVGVTFVRDSDSVVENRMLELKAQTARQDIITTRKAAAIGNPLVLISAKLRGFFDAIGLAWSLLWKRSSFAAETLKQLDRIAAAQYSHIDGDGLSEWPTTLSEPNAPKGQRW
jgi:hypothetical protein